MHPALESISRPRPVDGQEQWIPQDLHDHWQFKVKDGVSELRFEDLRYAGTAIGSYSSSAGCATKGSSRAARASRSRCR